MRTNNFASATSDVRESVVAPLFLALSTAWIGISSVRPASTEDGTTIPSVEKTEYPVFSRTGILDDEVFNYGNLFHMKIGDTVMPMSQTFSVRAKKKLNVSSLVDGIDIIQQTRKEAKTIDCVLKLSLNESQPALQLRNAAGEIQELARFLDRFYEDDMILKIANDKVNNVFGVEYVIISDYKFSPRAGFNHYTFEFSLTEVHFGENVLTFNLREVQSDVPKTQVGD